jgi:uncharacterized membrane protein YccC
MGTPVLIGWAAGDIGTGLTATIGAFTALYGSGRPVRVGIAALVAGAIASALSVQHAYWAIVAAVLILHQGLDWTRTVQRSLGRVLGTLAGLLLAGLILAAYPQGLWLVFTVALLQFIIESVVVRNYALAVMFITPLGLVIASGGRHVTDIARLLSARAVDTVVGCSVALATYWLTTRRASVPRLPDTMARTLEAAATVSRHLASGAVTTREALAARRDLQYWPPTCSSHTTRPSVGRSRSGTQPGGCGRP